MQQLEHLQIDANSVLKVCSMCVAVCLRFVLQCVGTVCYLVCQGGGQHAHQLPLGSQPPHLLPSQLPQTVEQQQNHP